MEHDPPAVAPERSDRTGAAVALVGFALVTAWSLHRHSLWLDETQSWAIARSARSLGDLWSIFDFLNPGLLQQIHKRSRRPIHDRDFFGVDVNHQIVQAQTGTGRHQVFHR